MGLFGSHRREDNPDMQLIESVRKEKRDLEHAHSLEIAELKSKHQLDLKEKEFELKHFKDEELLQVRTELTEEKQKNAVLEKENEMLVKITDLNADVIDVKGLVKDLIKKLPEVNISSLTVQGGKD